MVTCGFKNKPKKYICIEEIGLQAQNLLPIVDSIINKIKKVGYNVTEFQFPSNHL